MEIRIAFTHGPIAIPAPALPSREIGACVEFQGIVRELEAGRPLAGLHYEAYEPMAESQLERIFRELHTAHPCAAVHFIHRLGWVPWARPPSSFASSPPTAAKPSASSPKPSTA